MSDLLIWTLYDAGKENYMGNLIKWNGDIFPTRYCLLVCANIIEEVGCMHAALCAHGFIIVVVTPLVIVFKWFLKSRPFFFFIFTFYIVWNCMCKLHAESGSRPSIFNKNIYSLVCDITDEMGKLNELKLKVLPCELERSL